MKTPLLVFFLIDLVIFLSLKSCGFIHIHSKVSIIYDAPHVNPYEKFFIWADKLSDRRHYITCVQCFIYCLPFILVNDQYAP